MRNLIASASPRDLPQVLDERKRIPCDQYFRKYDFEGPAYRNIRNFFLEHEEYDGYLVIAPDDLIVTKKDYEILLADILAHDYPVISGICNINLSNLKDTFAASTFPNLEYCQFGYLKEENLSDGIMKVEWAGYPFTWIRRDVVEKISFTGRPGGRLENEGCSFDLQFAMEIQKLGIPQYIDCRVRMLHLWGAGMEDILKVGMRESFDQLMLAGIVSQHLVL